MNRSFAQSLFITAALMAVVVAFPAHAGDVGGRHADNDGDFSQFTSITIELAKLEQIAFGAFTTNLLTSEPKKIQNIASRTPGKASTEIAASDEFFGGSAVSENELGEMRGAFLDINVTGAETVGFSSQTANVSSNTLEGIVITGDNGISGNALSGSQGIFTVIQNSGNQVNVQQATVVNLYMAQ